eukprot:5544599-Pleurochrysis_carterae.AAC.1
MNELIQSYVLVACQKDIRIQDNPAIVSENPAIVSERWCSTPQHAKGSSCLACTDQCTLIRHETFRA